MIEYCDRCNTEIFMCLFCSCDLCGCNEAFNDPMYCIECGDEVADE